MVIAVFCAGLLALLVFSLGLAVSLQRQRSGRGVGHGGDPTDPLHKIVRAHGNATEYCALFAVLFLYLGSREPALWVVITIVVATAARYLHALGMVLSPTLDRAHPLRYLGSLFTYLAGLVLGVATLLDAVRLAEVL